MDEEDLDLEQEQLDYIRRNTSQLTVPNTNENYPDPLKGNTEQTIFLDPSQEKKLVKEIYKQIPYKKTENIGSSEFTMQRYISIISRSFINIIDDLLNFDGDLGIFQDIFIKEDRLVFIGTIIIFISAYLLVSR